MNRPMDMESILGPVAPIRGSCRLTSERAGRAYRLNCFFSSLTEPAQADRFRQDEASCMTAYGLDADEQAMVRERDYARMLDYGVALVALGKALRLLGINLVAFGSACRRQSIEDFLTTRRQANRGQPWEF